MITTIDHLQLNQTFSITTRITASDVETFGHIIGDLNPVHYDEAYAKTSIFKQRVAHGMFVGSLFSPILGMHLPGEGSIYLGQTLKFLKPTYFGDTITATVTIIEINKEKNIVVFETLATNQHQEIVVQGTATVMPPKEVKS